MSIQNYAVIDSNGNAINLVLWDGNPTSWRPPEGCTVELINAGNVPPYAGETPADQGDTPAG